jgi:5-(carboxyamino)imidazole ribonucleotide synthase
VILLNKQMIFPGQTIGIIGGGQLGRMMAIAAKQMGYNIAVLDPTPNSPCGQVADVEITASYNDLEAIKKLAELSDCITYEFENIDYDALTWLEQHAYLPQRSKLLAITQDREKEKQAIQQAGEKVAPYSIVATKEELETAVKNIGVPCVVKTCRGGYDGKGQCVIRTEEDIIHAIPLLNSGKCIVEAWVPFEKEISVIVTRSVQGEIKTFPVGENIHVENILHQTIVPARIEPNIAQKANDIAINLARSLQMVGTLAVEMFLTKEGEIYINELAPRPHNSGHYTIDACETSQFEQHIRAICNWPLGNTDLLKPVVMVNILGEHLPQSLKNIEHYSNCKLHLYGKKEAKTKRKMGHLNILADTIENALQKAESLTLFESEVTK